MTPADSEILARAGLLLGEEAMSRLSAAKVIIFGVGGVGSWCAECLARTGVGHLTIVDCDTVAVSNINRQLEATVENIGMSKVVAMRERLLSIRPAMDVNIIDKAYTPDSANDIDLEGYDCVIDCIDSLRDKQLLIERATASSTLFLSSMGAALKTDPTSIKVAEFRSVAGCPLARTLRQRFKKSGGFPRKKFKCVYSDEPVSNNGRAAGTNGTERIAADTVKRVNGSVMQITAIFGITLAGLAINALTDQSQAPA